MSKKEPDIRKCYLCGGTLIWNSEELISDDDSEDGIRYEVYLHCSCCKALICYAIPIKVAGEEE